jgi:gliding motility-associated-like protein
MFKRIQHMIVLVVLLFSFTQAVAQIAMPDTVCVGTNRIYKVNDATVPSTYTWKIDGKLQTSTRNDISIAWNSPGTFQLTVQEHAAGGCDGDIRSGLVYVIPPIAANAGPDSTICFGTTIRLNGSGGIKYQWSPSTYLSNAGIADPVANIPVAGTYQYVLSVSSNNKCSSTASDTVLITMLPRAVVFAGNDTAITINQPLQLNAIDVNNSGFNSYRWTPSFGLNNGSIKNPVAILNNNISYTVTAQTANGCTAKDDIAITVFVAPEIYVPTAFSPNNDGLNDILKPILAGIKTLKYFSVYNRYGQLVYQTSQQGRGWDGMFNGKMQNTGAFVWIAEAEDYKGNILVRKGTAMLIK